jgi:uncharacterized protein (TIRG00374 family)
MRRYVALVLTLLIFYLIFRKIDVQAFFHYFWQIHLGYLAVACSFFVFTLVVSVERWRWMLSNGTPLPFSVGARIFLAATSLNSLMPSKLGDLSKAYFLKQEGIAGLSRGGNSVLLEKLLDLSSLCAFFFVDVVLVGQFDSVVGGIGLFGGFIVVATAVFLMANHRQNVLIRVGLRLLARKPRLRHMMEDMQEFVREVKQDRWRFWGIIFLSLALWVLHLTQIYLFFRAMNADVPFRAVFGLVPIAIFVGLLPLTLGGMGTRDAALITLFAPYAPAALLAGVGMLVSTRYWVPSLVGLPLLRRYLAHKNPN